MKIFEIEQIRACDQMTMEEEGISSLQLMERAAKACLTQIKKQFGEETSFLIFCGSGNNGGDGLALTRLLHQERFKAHAILVKYKEPISEEAQANLTRLNQLADKLVIEMGPDDSLPTIEKNVVLIDALLGSGLNRPVEGGLATIITQLNQLPNYKIAIDIPSGLSADHLPKAEDVIFKVDQTFSFQFLKRTFLHPESAQFVGEINTLDIGLSRKAIRQLNTLYHFTDKGLVRGILRKRPHFSHKGNYGKACLIAGSYGMMGAAVLATKGALKSGAGLVWTYAPECGHTVLQSTCPEAMFLKGGETFIEKINIPEGLTLGIGPGLGKNVFTKRALLLLFSNSKNPLVLDADGINLLAEEEEEELKRLPEMSILTPHPGEFGRMFGTQGNSLLDVERARKVAQERKLVIVYKGHHTAVALPNGHCFYNSTGNPGMATGGCGDVLTGLITGLLAQGYSSEEAAILGVWIHGRAGDLALKDKGYESLLAGDLPDYIGKAFRELY